jgi:uncharacterized protein YegJ (DUF2314 family)
VARALPVLGIAALLLAPASRAQELKRKAYDHHLALLVTEPAPLDLDAIASAAGRAFGVKRAGSPEEFRAASGSTFYAGAFGHGFEIRFKNDLYRVRAGDVPAFSDVSAALQDRRVRPAILAQKGFVEFDAIATDAAKLDTKDPAGLKEALRKMAAHDAQRARELDDGVCRLAAEFWGQKPSAIYVSDGNHLFVVDDLTHDWLTSPQPRERLGSAGGAPVREIPADDRDLAAAIKSARSGWLRFVGAFGRKAGTDFRALVEVKEQDRSELVWVTVTKVDAMHLTGTIVNEPITIPTSAGAEITAARGQVCDWTYRAAEKTEGGYVLAVLAGR